MTLGFIYRSFVIYLYIFICLFICSHLSFYLYTLCIHSFNFIYFSIYMFFFCLSPIYLSFYSGYALSAIPRLNSCLADTRTWMAFNYLMQSIDKTELVLIGNPKRLSKLRNAELLVGNYEVKPSSYYENLDVYVDSALSVKTFIPKTAATAVHHIGSLTAIRDRLSMELFHGLRTLLIIIRLNGCMLYCWGFKDSWWSSG